MMQAKKMSLRQFTLQLGFSPAAGRYWLAVPGFQDCLKVVRKGRSTRYYVIDPEKAKEALKRAGYVIPEEGEDA
ncbi:hypothetical protein [Desulfurobacterium sp.]